MWEDSTHLTFQGTRLGRTAWEAEKWPIYLVPGLLWERLSRQASSL